ncbi:Transposon TX1 uncharacterized protein [Apiospora arundinis]
MLSKKGDLGPAGNYRPLSLMNVGYKIFTEILMQRLVDNIGGVTGLQQSAFLPGRLIDDNIRAVQQAIWNYEGDPNDGLAFVFLDQEKAYDQIKVLYENALTRPFVNGHFEDPIKVLSCVRQGNPISCPLFIITIEALARRIRTSEQLQGINLMNYEVLKELMYADDTTIECEVNGKIW